MRKRNFLHVPEYPGGKKSLGEYIRHHMQYPEEAVIHQVEGVVHLSASVDDNGKVQDITVEKGIGYGCDEEAIRLVKNLHFGGVTNRGIRLKTRKKFRIPFTLKSAGKPFHENKNFQYQYSYKVSEKSQGIKKADNASGVSKVVYSYTVEIPGQDPDPDVQTI